MSERLMAALADPSVIELMINPDGSVYVERAQARLERLDFRAAPDEALGLARALTGEAQEFGPRRPYADLLAADGSRVHVIAPPAARALTVTVRKLPRRRAGLDELTRGGMLTPACAGFLDYCVGRKLNLLIAGGTSSGKTTLLAALCGRIAASERILVLEDTPELALEQPHVVPLRTRLRDPQGAPDVSLSDLVVNVLRMRPDRVIVGETRGPEAADMLSAMNVGEDGVMTTLHANSPRDALFRLETLVLRSGLDLPLRALRSAIVGAIDLVVFVSRLADGSRRVAQVSEITGLEVDAVTMADLFVMDLRRGAGGAAARLRPAGALPRFYDRLRRQGVEPPLEFFRPDD